MDIEKIKIPGANSFELISIKAIETYAPQFIGYNKSFLDSGGLHLVDFIIRELKSHMIC